VRVGEANLDSAKIQELMEEVVLGKTVPFTELKDITDWSSIKKVRSIDIPLMSYSMSPSIINLTEKWQYKIPRGT